MLTPQQFYRDPHVISRILEYCGVPTTATAQFQTDSHSLEHNPSLHNLTQQMSVEYVSGWGDYLNTGKKQWGSRKNDQIGELLDHGVNLFRSVWDKENITFILDIEYISKKFPGEPYLNQTGTFTKLEPVYQCVWDILKEYNITPLTLVTGQGYHFVFDVPSFNRDGTTTTEAQTIVNLGYLEDTLQHKYEHPLEGKKRDRILEASLGKAFDGSSKLMEFIVHKTMQRIKEYNCKIPLTIGDVTAGNSMQETINMDLSTYNSPLYTRVMRTAFSIHSKHKDPKKDVGAAHIPIQITLPRHTPCNNRTLSLEELFSLRRHYHNAAQYASSITLNIPKVSIQSLLNDYQNSPLHKFHQDFDSTTAKQPVEWPHTYDCFDLNSLPSCVARSLEYPNPLLLQPTQIQTLVRVLQKKNGWHPKDIAGLIRSKYERNYNWDYNWQTHDAQRHANMWVRYYSALLATGIDQRTDQNCVSHQEKNSCPKPFCGNNLEKIR